MQVLTKTEVDARKQFFVRELRRSVFIYPTDTIYGIGCDALNGRLVDKIRELKGRQDMPFSVIAPSKDWVRQHCDVTAEGEEWLARLPGPYTLIFRVKQAEELPRSVNPGRDTLGVRIPDHWISELVAELGTPVITTSANRTGQNHLEDIDDIPSDWRDDIDFVLYDGEITGTPSTLVHLYEKEVVVQER